MEKVSIREAHPADVPAIRAINAAGLPGVAPLTQPEFDAIGRHLHCWVAEASDGVIGYLIAYRSSDAYDGEEFAWFRSHYTAFFYIDQIAIAPRNRHDGTGSALYRTAEKYALAHGCGAFTCEVNLDPPNPVSLSFHHALGFREVGVLHTEDGRTVALLHLPLPTAPPTAPPTASAPHSNASR